jgi:DNA-binding NtrC family response regulator
VNSLGLSSPAPAAPIAGAHVTGSPPRQAARRVDGRRKATILIVDDQKGARQLAMRELSELPNLEFVEAKSLEQAKAAIEETPTDLALVDIILTTQEEGDRTGLDLIRWIRDKHPDVSVIVMSGLDSFDVAREALRLGALDYFTKSELYDGLLTRRVAAVLERLALRTENADLRARVERGWGISALIGASAAIDQLRALVLHVAPSDAPVLVHGESGSGKTAVARALHEASSRRSEPFVEVSCAAWPPERLGSFLFGHGRGAIPGATRAQRGQLELAGGGTLLLEDIDALVPELQARLAQVLDDRRFSRLGEATQVAFPARLIASTSARLEDLIASGRFRRPLYDRLSVLAIHVPSLAERRTDIAEMVLAFGGAAIRPVRFTDDALAWLAARIWPGNVRELRNVVERASILTEETTIDRERLQALVLGPERAVGTTDALDEVVNRIAALPGLPAQNFELVERKVLARIFAATGGNFSEAARLWGLERRILKRRLEKLDEVGIAADESTESDEDA